MKNFNFYLGRLNWIDLQKMDIYQKDLGLLLISNNIQVVDFRDNGFIYAIGYTTNFKMLHFTFVLSKKANFHFEVLELEKADEKDIKTYWCRK